MSTRPPGRAASPNFGSATEAQAETVKASHTTANNTRICACDFTRLAPLFDCICWRPNEVHGVANKQELTIGKNRVFPAWMGGGLGRLGTKRNEASRAGNQDFLALISSRIIAATTGFKISRVTACNISGLILANTLATNASISCCELSAIFAVALAGFVATGSVTLSIA